MLQGGSLNFNAREWTGNAQSLGDHGGASHLDARAQEFVPPGKLMRVLNVVDCCVCLQVCLPSLL